MIRPRGSGRGWLGCGWPGRGWRRRLVILALVLVLTPVAQVLGLRWLDPPTSAFMIDRRLDGLRSTAQPVIIDYRWRPLSGIAPSLAIAVVAAEDQHFPSHHGFDLDAIDAAWSRRGGRLRGASTISQQVAKNLFLWSGRSWLRKGLEAGYTVLIEALWPKRRILEVYLNIAEFGDGIYGAEAAAQRFFGVPAAELGASESARLAAVLPNPRLFRVEAPSPHVSRRQRWIERQVRQLGGSAYLDACCGPLTGADRGDRR